MAGNKLAYRAKASTLLEVIIAMVVVVLVFGIAMMIFSNMVRLSLSAKEIKAKAILQKTLLKTEHSADKTGRVFTLDEFKIIEEAEPYSIDTGLTVIHLTAYDPNNQLIDELQKLIRNNP